MDKITLEFSRDELELLQSAFAVLMAGDGIYMMLRLPRLIGMHRGLRDKFDAALSAVRAEDHDG